MTPPSWFRPPGGQGAGGGPGSGGPGGGPTGEFPEFVSATMVIGRLCALFFARCTLHFALCTMHVAVCFFFDVRYVELARGAILSWSSPIRTDIPLSFWPFHGNRSGVRESESVTPGTIVGTAQKKWYVRLGVLSSRVRPKPTIHRFVRLAWV